MIETRTKRPRRSGGGRKKKKAEKIRSVFRSIRFSKDENERIQSHLKRLGKSFADYGRSLCLNPRTVVIPEKTFDVKVTLAQILKIGIHTNQIARALNNQYTQHDLSKIEKELAAISNNLSEIYNEISK